MLPPNIIKTKILDPSFRRNFMTEIDLVVENQERNKEPVSYITAIVELCEKHEIEPESIGTFLPKQYKDRIRMEAESLNLIKKKKNASKLPID